MREIVTYINGKPIYRRRMGFLPKNRDLTLRARALRKARNLAEVLFWMQVHKKKFYTIDFDRQRVIGNYIVDFYVKSLGLVIEIDGSSHIGKEEYDARREAYLIELGLLVYRISDTQVKYNLGTVMHELEQFILQEFSSPPNSPL